MDEYDLIVIGGGKAGKTLAMERAKKGWKVALIERQFIGGTCINVACIPTKTLVASARRLAQSRTNPTFGIAGTEEATLQLDALRAHKEGIVSGMVAAHEQMFAAPGIDFMRGQARLVGERQVEVVLEDGSTRSLKAPRVLINVGSSPAHLPIPGLWEAGAWDSEDILRLEELPETLTIIGGGYIGVEFAQMMAQFGVSVTVLNAADHLLPREDADVAEAMEAALSEVGVRILNGAQITHAESVEGGIATHLSTGESVVSQRVLVAVGRVPNTRDLGLAEAGVEVDERGFIRVDEHLRTTAQGVWASGDCAGTPMFTHASWNDYRLIREQFSDVPLDDPRTSSAGRLIPWAVFTTPELGRIGMSESEAVAAGHEVLVASIPTAAIPRAKTMRATSGLWKAVVDANTHRILGATLLGPESGEVITVLQVAMRAGMTYEELRMLPIAHPTMTEGLNILFDQLP